MTNTTALIEAPADGLVLSTDLDHIAADILSAWSRGIEQEFQIGHLLNQAATIVGDPMARSRDAQGRQSGSPFGDWVRAQNFPFSMKTAQRLRIAATREAEVRAFIAAHVGKRELGVNTAVALLSAATDTGVPEGERDAQSLNPGFVALRTGIYRLLGWEVDDEGVAGPTKNGLTALPTDQLAELKTLVEELAKAFGEAMQARRAAAA